MFFPECPHRFFFLHIFCQIFSSTRAIKILFMAYLENKDQKSHWERTTDIFIIIYCHLSLFFIPLVSISKRWKLVPMLCQSFNLLQISWLHHCGFNSHWFFFSKFNYWFYASQHCQWWKLFSPSFLFCWILCLALPKSWKYVGDFYKPIMLFVKFTNNVPCGNFFKSQFWEFSFETDFEFFQRIWKNFKFFQYLKVNGAGQSHCVDCHQKWITLYQSGYLLLSSPGSFGKKFWSCFNVMV